MGFLDDEMIFTVTNENLDSIVEGLDIQTTDIVLSIAACGDQPLALLENACMVFAVDISTKQLDYAKMMAELIRAGNYQRFLKKTREDVSLQIRDENMQGLTMGYMKAMLDREKYFSKPRRLDNIRGKLSYLFFEQADIFNMGLTDTFTKIYLSNAMYFRSMQDRLDLAARMLRNNGLIYITNGDCIPSCPPFQPPISAAMAHLTKDEELTKKARREYRWKSSIYRKVA